MVNPTGVPPPSLPLRRHPWYGSTLLTPPAWLEADTSNSRWAGEAARLLPATATPTPTTALEPGPVIGGSNGPITLNGSSSSSGNGSSGSSSNASGAAFLDDVRGAAEALADAMAAAQAAAAAAEASYNASVGRPCSLDLRREAGLAFCAAGLVGAGWGLGRLGGFGWHGTTGRKAEWPKVEVMRGLRGGALWRDTGIQQLLPLPLLPAYPAACLPCLSMCACVPTYAGVRPRLHS